VATVKDELHLVESLFYNTLDNYKDNYKICVYVFVNFWFQLYVVHFLLASYIFFAIYL